LGNQPILFFYPLTQIPHLVIFFHHFLLVFQLLFQKIFHFNLQNIYDVLRCCFYKFARFMFHKLYCISMHHLC
jgi:hypothetical protein